MDKPLWCQWNIPMEKAWFYERFFMEVVVVKDKNVMAKDKINTV